MGCSQCSVCALGGVGCFFFFAALGPGDHHACRDRSAQCRAVEERCSVPKFLPAFLHCFGLVVLQHSADGRKLTGVRFFGNITQPSGRSILKHLYKACSLPWPGASPAAQGRKVPGFAAIEALSCAADLGYEARSPELFASVVRSFGFVAGRST